jgi:hypothetical protein
MTDKHISLGKVAADALIAWSVWKLTGPGVLVIWLCLIGWYVEGTLGWIAFFFYLVFLIFLAFSAMHYLIFKINKESKFFGNKPLDRD